MDREFYNANKILSIKDKNGRDPELYFVCGNRAAGKTFYFKRWFVRRFIRHGEKFIVFVRFLVDIGGVSGGFWKDIGPLCYPNHELTQRPLLRGLAAELLLDGRPCGYVIALSDPERIKRNSTLFADAARGFMDEFMSERNKYVPREKQNFDSIRMSVARGGAEGKHARRFPVYLCANNVSLFNPYFDALGIGSLIQNRTRYMRGDGWVLEQVFNQEASDAIRDNFHTIGEKDLAYAAGNEYLLDTTAFIADMPGEKVGVCRIRYKGKIFGVWSRFDAPWWISSKIADRSTPCFVLDVLDHDEGTRLITRGDVIYTRLRKDYNAGNVRFQNAAAKAAFLAAMAIQ